MDNTPKKTPVYTTAEINSIDSGTKAEFSVEPSNTKPFNIALMTGNNQNNNKGSEKK